MEPHERKRIEILAGACFIVFLLILVFLVIGVASATTKTEIKDSFNTYNINTQYSYSPPTSQHLVAYERNTRVYPGEIRYVRETRHLEYDSWSRLEVVKGLFGNDIAKYEVYVKNLEYVGGYFKVVYYFEDYYGDEETETLTYYVNPREEGRFVVKDISPSRYDYKRWWYTVTPLKKAPVKVYYTDDYRYYN